MSFSHRSIFSRCFLGGSTSFSLSSRDIVLLTDANPSRDWLCLSFCLIRSGLSLRVSAQFIVPFTWCLFEVERAQRNLACCFLADTEYVVYYKLNNIGI